MAIYISGSLAYDRIMHFPGKFTDSILPDQLHTLTVSFFIDRLEEKLGGCAGNIAYTLALLGEHPIIVATAGRDFDRYATMLREHALSLEGITRLEDELCAGAYIMTDDANNQITAFHAAAMMTPSGYDFPRLNPKEDLALISPSNPDDMNAHSALYREKGVRYIYDPSQQLPMLNGEQLLQAIGGAYLLIGNEYEIQVIMSATGRTQAELAAMTAKGLITTLGEKGSRVTDNATRQEYAVPAVPVGKALDITGAGDAYRSGLLKGLALGQSLLESARLGAACAAFCIEAPGTQGHDFSVDEFFQRHAKAFGNSL